MSKPSTHSKGQTTSLFVLESESENRYGLVHKVARRAKQIMEGHAQTSAELSNNRAIKAAIKELVAEQ
ncbi:MAG: DNA-directed RNA polymerase subunit omega [Candidatus Sericytochromatia bacterium]|nr:DNA-directed RNA polymerase subunit omega [Candidatus Sericytochromatia bacterium]